MFLQLEARLTKERAGVWLHNNMKILHAAQMRITPIGIIHQMEYEQKAAVELGIPWESKLYCPSKVQSTILVTPTHRANSWLAFRRGFYKWLDSQVKHFDVILLRYSLNDPFQPFFIKRCPIPVITMHHTLEVPQLRCEEDRKGDVLAMFEWLAGRFALQHVHGVAAVTREIGAYEVMRTGDSSTPFYYYPNGAVYDNNSVIEAQSEAGSHQFLYVSSQFYPWMGLDLLLEASLKSKDDYIIHIVGELTDEQRRALSQDGRFMLHGILSKDEIGALVSKSTLGLSTFAIERKKFTEGNTLKVMEYLKSGLPVYAGYKDVFDESFPFYRIGSADMDKILAYADYVRPFSREEISNSARPIIDKTVLVKRFYGEVLDKLEHTMD